MHPLLAFKNIYGVPAMCQARRKALGTQQEEATLTSDLTPVGSFLKRNSHICTDKQRVFKTNPKKGARAEGPTPAGYKTCCDAQS